MQVLGVGEVVLDKIIQLKDFLQEGEKVDPQKIELSVGGSVVTALILLSHLGVKCRLVAAIGRDAAGFQVKKQLEKEKIQLLPKVGVHTKVNTVLINSTNGSRTIIKDRLVSLPIKNVSKKVVRESDIIIFDRHEPEMFDKIVADKHSETKVIIDPSVEASSKTINMVKKADYPVLPIEGLIKMLKHGALGENLEEMYKIVRRPIVVTLGGQGSLSFDGSGIQFAPAVDIEPVSMLGAGDVFRGALAFGILENWPIKRMLEFSNMAAGLQCTKAGNGETVPTRKELVQFELIAKYKHTKLDDAWNL